MYERNRKGGLGALGWTGSWRFAPPATDQSVQSGVGCGFPQVGHRAICGRPEERSFMINQGCVPTPIDGFENCVTDGGNQGEIYCCPPGRPGTAETAGTTVAYQVPVSRGDIRSLQNYIISQGCSVGDSGADGIYGPNTAAGLQCLIGRSTYYDVASRFPFISTLVATPTGQERPDDFTFDPGLTAKTPEQMVWAFQSGQLTSGAVSNSGSTQADLNIEEQRRQEAGIAGALPWWGWALIAAGGAGLLAFVGLALLGKVEDDDFYDEDHLSYLRGYGYE